MLNQLVASCFFFFFSCDLPIFKIKFLKKTNNYDVSLYHKLTEYFEFSSSVLLLHWPAQSAAQILTIGVSTTYSFTRSHSGLSICACCLTAPQPDDTIADGVLSRAALLLLLVGKQSRPKRRRDDSARTFAAQLYVPLDLLEYKPDGGHTCLLLL